MEPAVATLYPVVVRGTDGPDVLSGGPGADRLFGLAGHDRLVGGRGADFLHGGLGRDAADYSLSPAGVQVYLDGAPGAGGHAAGDVLAAIEDVDGSPYGDRLYGDAAANRLSGGAGYDYLDGGPGADVLDGGVDPGYDYGLPGYSRDARWGDTAAYTSSDAAVTVDLAAGTAAGGDAQGDVLRAVESVRGSDYADLLTARDDDPNTRSWPPEGSHLWGQRGDDTLVGGSGRDFLWGGRGVDSLLGGVGDDYLEGGAGPDVLEGGPGLDRAGYELSEAGVTVDLAAGTGRGGHAEGDELSGTEQLKGSAHADHLTGDAASNTLSGWDGDDTLDGADGNDRLYGGRGHDIVDGGADNDYLDGGPGADLLDGGAGGDWADYWQSDGGVSVDLGGGRGKGADAEGDALVAVEHVRGSYDHPDRLTGDREANRLDGWGGADELFGAGGADTLLGGDGDDLLVGGRGADVLRGEWGRDRLDGGDGPDVLDGGAGDDVLSGGPGTDRFLFSVGGRDRVTDFTAGEDLIDLASFVAVDAGNFDQHVLVRQADADVEIVIGHRVLILAGIDAADVTVDDFLFA